MAARQVYRELLKKVVRSDHLKGTKNISLWKKEIRSMFEEESWGPNIPVERRLLAGKTFLGLHDAKITQMDLFKKYWIGTHIPTKERLQRDAQRVGLALPSIYDENDEEFENMTETSETKNA